MTAATIDPPPASPPFHGERGERGERPALTPRQADILAFMRSHLEREQGLPTVREIGAEFGIRSPNGVVCHLDVLVTKGRLYHDPKISRGYKLAGVTVSVTGGA